VSKESVDAKKAQVRSKLYPVQVLKHNAVPIEVRPLRYGKIPEAIDFLWEFFQKSSAGELTKEFLLESLDSLNRYLNECVRIPDDPEMTIEDLPFDALPAVIEVFLEQTLKPGNWQALAQKLKETLGVTIATPLGQGQP
jgi:hypothetical protein